VVLTQIYGITAVEDAAAVDRLNPDHIGLVVDEGIDTWDSVDPDTATAIAHTVTHARLVALSLSTDPMRIRATAQLVGPSIMHLAVPTKCPSRRSRRFVRCSRRAS
jgi:phosphoribosylanthranilate isomerase